MNRIHLLTLVCLAFTPLLADAHPLEKCHFDRTIEVRLEPGAVNIKYTLELSDLSMTLDLQHFMDLNELAQVKGEMGLARMYAERKTKFMAGGTILVLHNGQAVKLKLVENVKVERVPKDNTYKIVAVFRGNWRPLADKQNTVEFTDDTEYVGVNGDKALEADGSVFLTIDERQKPGPVTLTDYTQPDDLRGKVLRDIAKPEDQARRRRCSGTFTVDAAALAALPSQPTETSPTTVEVAPDNRGVIAKFLDRGPIVLLESDLGLAVLLLLAAGFGAAHAFTPGHGKTMVAAFLVGEKGTIRHAMVLGFTATLAHTGSVILVALLMYGIYGNTPPADAQGWLMMIGGLLIVLVGFWLFMQRLKGQADHVHLFSHHHHDDPAKAKTQFGWLRVILMGLGGGIIPCWDAVLLFLLAMAQGRVGLAIPLLIAFSVGLALVLILLGIGVVLAHRAGGKYFRERRWFKALPILSAVILLAFGVWFLREGYQMVSRGVG